MSVGQSLKGCKVTDSPSNFEDAPIVLVQCAVGRVAEFFQPTNFDSL